MRHDLNTFQRRVVVAALEILLLGDLFEHTGVVREGHGGGQHHWRNNRGDCRGVTGGARSTGGSRDAQS